MLLVALDISIEQECDLENFYLEESFTNFLHDVVYVVTSVSPPLPMECASVQTSTSTEYAGEISEIVIK